MTIEIDRIRALVLPARVGYGLPVAFLVTLGLAGWGAGLLPLAAVFPLGALAAAVVWASRSAVWQLDCSGEALVLVREVLGCRVERIVWKMEEIGGFTADEGRLAIAFVGRPPWTLETAPHGREDLQHLVALLEEVRRSSAAFWRDELAAERQRERARLLRIRERGE